MDWCQMNKNDIQVGLKVCDPTIKVYYTWVSGQYTVSDEPIQLLCSMCGYPDKFMLREDEPVVNTFGDSYRAHYCMDCSGWEDLVYTFKIA